MGGAGGASWACRSLTSSQLPSLTAQPEGVSTGPPAQHATHLPYALTAEVEWACFGRNNVRNSCGSHGERFSESASREGWKLAMAWLQCSWAPVCQTARHFFAEPAPSKPVETSGKVTQHPPGTQTPEATPEPHPMSIRKRRVELSQRVCPWRAAGRAAIAGLLLKGTCFQRRGGRLRTWQCFGKAQLCRGLSTTEAHSCQLHPAHFRARGSSELVM